MNRDTRRTRIILGLLLLTSLTLITVDFRGEGSSPLQPLRSLAGAVLGPVERAAAAVAGPVSDFADTVGSLGDSEERIAELERENDALRLELRTSERARQRAAELDSLLRVAGVGQYRVLPAQVVGFAPAQGFGATVTIDAGTSDGIVKDMTVLNGDGLVGRVTAVSPSTATVLLIVDPVSSIGVRVEATNEIGFADGRGAGASLSLSLLDPQSPVRDGDRLVTQGEAVFAPGIPVGEIHDLENAPGSLTRSGSVTPYVDFTALDVVGVVVQEPRRDPRDAVLPPRPAQGDEGGG
jgi:rod shape-determining protein MreC